MLQQTVQKTLKIKLKDLHMYRDCLFKSCHSLWKWMFLGKLKFVKCLKIINVNSSPPPPHPLSYVKKKPAYWLLPTLDVLLLFIHRIAFIPKKPGDESFLLQYTRKVVEMIHQMIGFLTYSIL